MEFILFLLFVLARIEHAPADVAVKESKIILYQIETFFNLWMFFELDRTCGETSMYNVRTINKMEILKEINPGDLKINYTITSGSHSTEENEIDFCLVDTESDVKGGFVYVIRQFLGLEQECPQTVGSKKQRYIEKIVGNMHYPWQSSEFRFEGAIYSVEGPIVTISILAKPRPLIPMSNAFGWPG